MADVHTEELLSRLQKMSASAQRLSAAQRRFLQHNAAVAEAADGSASALSRLALAAVGTTPMPARTTPGLAGSNSEAAS
jgi:hypothetical protein